MQRRNPNNIHVKDTHQTKYTPRTRPAHQAAHSGALVNADPQKRYCLVPTNVNHPMGITFYKSRGYEVELNTGEKDCVKIIMGTEVKTGEPLTWQEMVLMSVSEERANEIFLKGDTGSTGQEYFDMLMRRIQRNPTLKRPNEVLPGLHESYDINNPDDDLNDNKFR